ncbi:uncharacterized protein LOC109621897 [Aedes albopictus]|uniref:Uncharacterized protein n=1 Tax=Aedes albopictus TaxID=7160 RepID=A0ABM1ZB83_AEDAL|nr:uncharacterized protein LOC109621897 [Aedes albopictus]
MARLVPIVVLVLSALSGIRCEFGLDVAAPTVSSAIATAIGSGISSVVRANASIKIDSSADGSGTVNTLIVISNNVTNPMNKLLGSILAGASSRNANSQEMFNNFSELIKNTSKAIVSANTTADDLKTVTKVYLYEYMIGNLTALNNTLQNLSNGLNMMQSQVQLAANAEYPPTILNITVYFNKTVVANLTTPLRSIRKYLTSIGSTITTIAAERSQAIAYRAQFNETISAGVRSIDSAAVTFNRTVVDVYHRISQQQTNTFKAINQTYASVLNRADSYGINMRNLTQFLSDMVTANASFTQFVELSTNYSTEQVTKALHEQTTAVTATLLTVINFVTNQSVTNSSVNTASCTQKAVQQLQQNPVAMNRLASCMQSETNSFRTTTQFVQVQMDAVRNAAASLAVQMSRICQRETGPCTAYFFSAFPDHSQRVQNKISVVAGGVSNDEHIVTGRIVDCVNGVGSDIVANAQIIQSKFVTCLGTIRVAPVEVE